MTTIIVNNSVCKINDLPKEAEKEIKFHLKYLSQATSYVYNKNIKEIEYLRRISKDSRFGTNQAHIQNEIISLERQNAHLRHKLYISLYKKGEFPTGLLPKVEELLTNASVEYKLIEERVRPQRNKIKYILKESLPPLRYYQRTGARLAVENGRGILVMPTGAGKTLAVTRMIWELGVKTLVITPSKTITDNMIDTLTKYFGKGKVGRLNTKSKDIKDINVCNIQALVKIDPKVLEDIDAVFIDEFHHCFRKTTMISTSFRGKKSIKEVYEHFHKGYSLKVKSWDGEKFINKKVTNAFVYKSPKKLLKIKIRDEDGKIKEIICTSNHKISTPEGYIKAGDLMLNGEINLGYITGKEARRRRKAR